MNGPKMSEILFAAADGCLQAQRDYYGSRRGGVMHHVNERQEQAFENAKITASMFRGLAELYKAYEANE